MVGASVSDEYNQKSPPALWNLGSGRLDRGECSSSCGLRCRFISTECPAWGIVWNGKKKTERFSIYDSAAGRLDEFCQRPIPWPPHSSLNGSGTLKRATYKEDGSSLWSVITSFAAGNQTAISSANQDILNGDQSQTAQFLTLISSANVYSGIIHKFPKASNIEKIFLSFIWATPGTGGSSTLLVEVSADSTDGNDGAWTTIYTSSLTVPATTSAFRMFLQTQTPDELTATYTYLRISWSAHAQLNALRLLNYWAYLEPTSPPYDFYDGQGITKIQVGEMLLGLFAGNAAVDKTFKFQIKNNDTVSRTYTLTFAKVKVTADAVFVTHIGLTTDGTSAVASSIALTVAAGESADWYLHVDIPISTGANGNPQDGAVHYGKITVAASGVTTLPGLIFAVYYDTLANIEVVQGTGLTAICLVYQRDMTDKGEIASWSWWDVTGVGACVQQEAVGNDIVILQTSDGFLWEMDRDEYDNEAFTPLPILMILKTVESPTRKNPHTLKRNLWFDFDVDGADGGICAEHILHAHKETGIVTTTQDIKISHSAMRVAALDIGFYFNHELRVTTGGKLAIKNYSHSFQELTDRGRLPFVAGV